MIVHLTLITCLMWAYATIMLFAKLTINAQNLKVSRIIIFPKPPQKLGTRSMNFFSHFCAIIIHVVNCKEFLPSFAATTTGVSSIMRIYFIFKSFVLYFALVFTIFTVLAICNIIFMAMHAKSIINPFFTNFQLFIITVLTGCFCDQWRFAAIFTDTLRSSFRCPDRFCFSFSFSFFICFSFVQAQRTRSGIYSGRKFTTAYAKVLFAA